MTGDPEFIHLRVRSSYSLLEGALPVGRIAELALRHRLPAVGLTDTNNLFGALEFSETMAGAGIQPIVGCALAVDFADGETGGRGPAPRYPALALLAGSAAGYANLMRLSSSAFLVDRGGGPPRVGTGELGSFADGLIVLTGGGSGPIDRAIAAGQRDLARSRLEWLRSVFADRLYVEIQRHGLAGEAECEREILRLAYGHDLPIVATNDVFFATGADHAAHDALICIAEGEVVANEDRRRLSPNQHFRPPSEMAALFSDLPEALSTSVEIARRCVARPELRAPILPRFPSADGGAAADEAGELERQAREGLEARLAAHGPAPGFTPADYRARLDHELAIINDMAYPGYFLIVSEIIKWSKAEGIPVGPGRGSGAASVVAWALTITDLDPLRFNLVFERFLNPHRVSMPDFDIDFCPVRRDEVIGHIRDTYGHDRVAQIITFGKLQARAVLRDVGRVLQMPYGQVDRLCKLVPNNPADPVTLADAIASEPRLGEERDSDETVARLLEIGQALEGLYRHASTHAAGVVIGDRPLIDLVPLYRDPRTEMPVTQFNMKWVEQAGLVKFDILGLKTLTVIETCVRIVREAGTAIDISRIPLDDRRTFALLGRGETAGVFQFESAGMRDLLVRAEPSNFEDLIALVALFRPGPMENIPKYLASKHGAEQPERLHELIEPVVADTYGVIIYQEQVLQIAQRLAGFSLGEADLLRRAMGKKIKSEMDGQRARFIDGAAANGVDRARAEYIFHLVDKFAGYGFNKAHSAAYALVAYQTAYLKANHPLEFLAAVMTHDIGNTDKLAQLRGEAERIGAAILPPSVNRSERDFSVEGGAIRYAMAALRNVGRPAVDHIIAAREQGGDFVSIADFASRIDPQFVNRRALESLARAGAFDCLEDNRAAVVGAIDAIVGEAQRAHAARLDGQVDMFAAAGGRSTVQIKLPAVPPWDAMTRLNAEFEAVGSYLSGHPLDGFEAALAAAGASRWRDFETAVRERGHRAARLAGTVTARRDRRGRAGNHYAFVSFSDPSGQFEAVVFSDVLGEAGPALDVGRAVMMRVEADVEGDRVRLRVQDARPLDATLVADRTRLRILIRDDAPLAALAARLSPGDGADQVSIVLLDPASAREIELELDGCYGAGEAVARSIRSIPGVVAVETGPACEPARRARLSSVG